LPTYVLGSPTVAMISFIPKFCALSISDAYKAEIESKNYENSFDTVKGEYIFLLDRSGSMGDMRI
jgi:uncharacterized protein with von Willebrand factor type A (vWA) domain